MTPYYVSDTYPYPIHPLSLELCKKTDVSVYLYLCNIPQTQNFIAKLQVEGQCITEHDESAAILDIYSNLIGTDRDRSRTVNLDGIDLPSYDFAALYYPITEDEVWSPIKQLPSQGGFTIFCWHIIKEDFLAAIQSIWGKDFRNL